MGVEIDRQEKWDIRFLEAAKLVASWSKDPSTKCGAVIVRPDLTIASTGFNGFPKGCSDADEVYADRELKYARVVHAELNAILHAREPLNGYTIYTYPAGYGPSCDRCSAHIIQAGITRVVHIEDTSDFALRWKDSSQRGYDMYREARVNIAHYRSNDDDELFCPLLVGESWVSPDGNVYGYGSSNELNHVRL